MMKLEDFKVSKIESKKSITGGADPNVTPGGSHTYYGAYYPGGQATRTWSSDYDGVGGMEWCDLTTTYG